MWVGDEDVCLCGHHILTHLAYAYRCKECICGKYERVKEKES